MKLIARALLLALFPAPVFALAPADVDAYFSARWAAKGLAPSETVSDGLFLRRAWLDIDGVIPSASDVREFEADTSPGKRAAAVERLLGSPLYGESWGDRFRTLLLQEDISKKNRRLARPFDKWLAQEINANTPYDKFVTRLISGTGSAYENPEVSYVAQFKDSPEALTGHMAKTFLGVQIQCAQCHDHPFEKWKRTEFYGLHAFFARAKGFPVPVAGLQALRSGHVEEALAMAEKAGKDPTKLRRRAKAIGRIVSNLPPPSLDASNMLALDTSGGKGGFNGKTFVVVDRPRGEAVMPDLKAPPADKKRQVEGATIAPRFLDGTQPAYPDFGVNRRAELAAWMTSPQNPYFARALVNRVWSVMLGRGLVEPVDNVANPTDKAHDELLQKLAADFIASHFDLKALVRLIASTQVYQRSIQPSATNSNDRTEFSRGLTRPMDSEQLFASLLQATGAEEAMRIRNSDKFDEVREKMMTRFAKVFENDASGEEESFHGTLSQALFLMNSPAINASAGPVPGGVVRTAIQACGRGADRSAGIEQLYLSAYARPPTAAESAAAGSFLAARAPSAPNPRINAMGWSDLLWAMVTSAEFLVNH